MASDPSRLHALGAAVLLAALSLAAPAAAQQPSAADKETARALMDKGDEKLDAKDYAGAIKAYEAADAIMHLPQTGIALAKAQAAAGLLVEARDVAMQVARIPVQPGETAPFTRARAEAAELANSLAGRIPSIQVVLTGAPAGVSVSVDGAVIPPAAATEPRKVNPGSHVVAVTAPGFQPARVEVTLREGAAQKVPVTLEPASGAVRPPETSPVKPPPGALPVAPEPRRTSPLVYVGFGVGGASLIAGAITGGMSLAKTSSVKGSCTNGNCPGKADDLASANLLANVSNVTIGVGLAGAVLGVVGVVISKPAPKPAAAARVEPLLGPGTIGLRGTF